MGSFRTCRYAMFVLFLYAIVFHVLVTIFPFSYTCLYLCFVCLFKNEKSDPVMIMLYGVLPYDEHYGYKYKVELFANLIVNFLLLTHNDR